MLDALIGVYERNVLGYLCTAVLPYSPGIEPIPGSFTAAGYGIKRQERESLR